MISIPGHEPKPLLTGLDLNGKPYSIMAGEVGVVHYIHESWCPGGKGWPERCECVPEIRLGPFTPEVEADLRHQAEIRRRDGK